MKEESLLSASDDAEAYAHRLFLRLFTSEHYAQRSVKGRWVSRAPPTTLFLSELLQQPVNTPTGRAARTHALQPVAAYARQLVAVTARIMRECADDVGNMVFDKDDELSLDFVCAASNLRAHAYGIPMQSEFELTGIAGNIVHAVATTNAIAAGFIVLEAIKTLSVPRARALTEQEKAKLRATFQVVFIPDFFPRVINGTPIPPPAPHCFCGLPVATLYADLDKLTFGAFYGAVEAMGATDPSVRSMIGEKTFGCMMDIEDANPALLEKPVSELGFTHGEFVLAMDDDSPAQYVVRLVNKSAADRKDITTSDDRMIVSDDYTIEGELPLIKSALKAAREAPTSDAAQEQAAASDDDDLCDVTESAEGGDGASLESDDAGSLDGPISLD
jgi:ubiquitin-like 1-activating enzyme E1 B